MQNVCMYKMVVYPRAGLGVVYPRAGLGLSSHKFDSSKQKKTAF